MPARSYQPDVEDIEDEYDAGLRRNKISTASKGTAANPIDVDDNNTIIDTTASTPRDYPPIDPSLISRGRFPAYPIWAYPLTHYQRHTNPYGIYIGTWVRSGLPAVKSNAVFALGDSKGRVHRRISTLTYSKWIAIGGNYDPQCTACSHEDINYCASYEGMSKEEIDADLRPKLEAISKATRSASPVSRTLERVR